jgi:hypothetical protein
MSDRNHVFLIISGMVFCALLFAACVSTSIGEVAYAGGGVSLSVSQDSGPSEGYVQVTVYRITDNQQKETEVLYAPLALQRGENTAFIPATLEPGHYKLYIYLIQDGERKAATIRDIVVN